MVVFLICRIMLKSENFSIVPGSSVNESKWDALLATSSIQQKLYSAKWFLDIVQPDWLAVYINDYEAGFVLPRKKKFGIAYLVQPLFCQQFNVLGNSSLFTPAIFQELFFLIERNFPKAQFNVGFKLDSPSVEWTIKERTNCKLLIGENYFDNYGSQIRRHLTQSKKHILSNTYVNSPSEIIQLFRSNNNLKKGYFKKNELDLLERIVLSEERKGNFVFQELRNEKGEILSGAIWFFLHNEAIFLFSARNMKAVEKGFFTLMIDRFIESHLSRGGILDFEGSDQEGLKRYYLGFGGKSEPYWMLRKNLSVSLSMI